MTNVCPRCMYIGHRHLCGCIARLGEALRQGDLDAARALFEKLVRDANADIR
jgi:hypothetical protein